MTFDTVTDLLSYQLRDLYSFEVQVQQAIPQLTESALNRRLARSLEAYSIDSEGHLVRLEQCCSELGVSPRGIHCSGMEGLLKELQVGVRRHGSDRLHDASLLADCRRVGHFGSAMYGNAIALCCGIGERRIARLLERNRTTHESHLVITDHLSQHELCDNRALNPPQESSTPRLQLVGTGGPTNEHRASRR